MPHLKAHSMLRYLHTKNGVETKQIDEDVEPIQILVGCKLTDGQSNS